MVTLAAVSYVYSSLTGAENQEVAAADYLRSTVAVAEVQLRHITLVLDLR